MKVVSCNQRRGFSRRMQCYFCSTTSSNSTSNMISAHGRPTQRKLFDATRKGVKKRATSLASLRPSHMERHPSRLSIFMRPAPPLHQSIFLFTEELGGCWAKGTAPLLPGNFVRSGIHFIALDFAQLPSVSLGGMVAQVRRAVAWVYENARKFDGDPAQIHISGHSSGGHLAACVAVTDWTSEFGLPPCIVKSAICASGIYDLRPVRLSARNDYVKLNAETEQALSPIRHLERLSTSVFVACGSRESDEFKRQSSRICSSTGSSAGCPTHRIAGA